MTIVTEERVFDFLLVLLWPIMAVVCLAGCLLLAVTGRTA